MPGGMPHGFQEKFVTLDPINSAKQKPVLHKDRALKTIKQQVSSFQIILCSHRRRDKHPNEIYDRHGRRAHTPMPVQARKLIIVSYKSRRMVF